LHAFVFAGTITFVIAAVVLYYDYGFWHEHYSRGNDDVVVASSTSNQGLNESPFDALSRFFGEARDQFKGVASSSTSIFEGKESYSKAVESTTTGSIQTTSGSQ
jgi:hypothetical protein